MRAIGMLRRGPLAQEADAMEELAEMVREKKKADVMTDTESRVTSPTCRPASGIAGLTSIILGLLGMREAA